MSLPLWFLDRAGAEANRLLTTPCVVKRPGVVVDEYGDRAPSEATVETTTCRLLLKRDKASGEVVGQEANRVFYRMILPLGTDIRDGDHVMVGGDRFEVLKLVTMLTDGLYIEAEVSKFKT